MTKNYGVLLYEFPSFLYKMKNHAFFSGLFCPFNCSYYLRTTNQKK